MSFSRYCPNCNSVINYNNRSGLQSATKRNSRCMLCRNNIIREQKLGKKLKDNHLQKQKRIKRKEKLSIDITKLFLIRTCPQCNCNKITYKSEKSALQAEEKRTICASCKNKNKHKIPGYTEKIIQKATQFAQKTKGTSKMERRLIPILTPLGFSHTSQRSNVFLAKKLVPDFVNEQNKIVIEIYGTYWHCDPKHKIYSNPNYYHSQVKLTAQQIWKKDARQQIRYREMKYFPIIIWENEIKNKSDQDLTRLILDQLPTP